MEIKYQFMGFFDCVPPGKGFYDGTLFASTNLLF